VHEFAIQNPRSARGNGLGGPNRERRYGTPKRAAVSGTSERANAKTAAKKKGSRKGGTQGDDY
jgi:hypothetical protein